MKQFFTTVLGVVVGMILFSVVATFALVGMIGAIGAMSLSGAGQAKPNPSGDLVLEVDLRMAMTDAPRAGPWAGIIEQPSHVELLRAIDSAAGDDDVKGMVVRAPSMGMSPAQAEEFAAALAAFQSEGKFVLAHADILGPSALFSYAAIAGADEIWMPRRGDFMVAGFMSEPMFYKGTLEKIGVEADFVKYAEYKNAPNVYTETGFTDEHREATVFLLKGLHEGALALASQGRDIEPATLETYYAGAPYMAEEAVEMGLIDKLGHAEDMIEYAEAYYDEDDEASVISIFDYAQNRNPRGATFALITGEGPVMPGESDAGGFNSDPVMGGDTVARAFDLAAENDKIDVIIFRVNSPGGSALASDQILAAIERAQAKDKKVIVSMGPVAASGGYWVAAKADAIVASPSTITGSIGVFFGKFVVDDAFDKVGLSTDRVVEGGEFATAFSSVETWNQDQRARVTKLAESVYDNFLDLVAEGRGMDRDEAHEVARGRVWTGRQAEERGLVDDVTGFTGALAKGREFAELEPGAPVRLQIYPPEPTPAEALRALFGASEEAARSMALISQLSEAPVISDALAQLEAYEQIAGSPGSQARAPELVEELGGLR